MLFSALLALASVSSNVAAGSALPQRSALEPYAPYPVACPSTPLIRGAKTLSSDEIAYVTQRKAIAQTNLAAWVKKAWGMSSSLNATSMPTVAMAMSGGGPKAGLISAGVVYGFDDRDTSNGVSGLLQSLTYLSALSGGSLTLTSIMGNDFSKISTLKKNLYDKTYQNVFTVPLEHLPQITADILAKEAAGTPTSVIDIYGRGIAYDFIGGPGGANGVTWSGILKQSAFTSHEAPYPIITLSNVFVLEGQNNANNSGIVWEVAPYEFGSFDPTIQAFVPTEYLGTTLINGAPAFKGLCLNGFDNAGFISGMSSDILTDLFPVNSSTSTNGSQTIPDALAVALNKLFPALAGTITESIYGLIPNPFYKYAPSNSVSGQRELYMEDGGDAGQDIPIFPFLQPQRSVDVIIAIDEGGGPGNVTDGSSLSDTYTRAQMIGLDRMPPVPTTQVFEAQKLYKRAQFFGCYNTSLATLIYIPDGNETQTSSDMFTFTPEMINLVFTEGTAMATQGGNTQWPECLACAIMHKEMTTLPKVCTTCLQEYCYTG